MITAKEQEYLKRQMATSSGETPEDRMHWYTLELVYSLHKKVNQLNNAVEAVREILANDD